LWSLDCILHPSVGCGCGSRELGALPLGPVCFSGQLAYLRRRGSGGDFAGGGSRCQTTDLTSLKRRPRLQHAVCACLRAAVDTKIQLVSWESITLLRYDEPDKAVQILIREARDHGGHGQLKWPATRRLVARTVMPGVDVRGCESFLEDQSRSRACKTSHP
jgi:hypothetical protein